MKLFQTSKPRPKEEHPTRYSIVSPSPFAVCETCQEIYEIEQQHRCSEFLLAAHALNRLARLWEPVVGRLAASIETE